MPDSSATPAVIACDVGGTSVKCLTVTRSGVLEVRTRPTRAHQGPEAALETVLEEVDCALTAANAGHRVVGVGIASPGAVDETRGVCVGSENLGWQDVPLRELVGARTGLPVGFGHDVRAGGLAERYMGAGRGAAHQAYLSVGTGIAAALMLDGAAVVADGYAGEVGHGGALEGEHCACGGRGCAETYASAAAMARRYARLAGTPVDGARGLLTRVHAGDPIAQQVWEEGLDGLARIASDLVRVTGVARIVVGGGLALAGEALLAPLAARTRGLLTSHRVPELVPAALAGVSGSWGTALLGWDAAGYDLEEVAAEYLELGRRRSLTEAVA